MEIVIDEDVLITSEELTTGLLWKTHIMVVLKKWKLIFNKTEINADNISFFLLFLNLAYWYPYICLHQTMNKLNLMYYVKSI